MKTIYLRSSELAKLTGHNTYEPLEKTIQTILSFNQIQDVYVPKTNIEKGLLDVNPETNLHLRYKKRKLFKKYNLGYNKIYKSNEVFKKKKTI